MLTSFSSDPTFLHRRLSGWKTCACTLLFTLALSFAAAQSALQFTRFGVGEGLPQNSVYGLMQDRAGFLWVATGDGLARYDGQRFGPFRSLTRGTGATVAYGPLVEDRWGRVFFCSEKDVMVMDARRGSAAMLSRIVSPLRTGGHASVLGIDAHDTLWVAVTGRLMGISLHTGGWSTSGNAPANAVHGGAVLTSNGNLYYANSAGLCRYDRRARRGVLGVRQPGIYHVLELPDGRLAMSCRTGVCFWNPKQPDNTPRRYTIDSTVYPAPGAMAFHRQSNTLYFLLGGSGIGSLALHTGKWTLHQHQPADPLSLPTNLTLCLFIDRSENLWIGTEGGGLCRADLKPPKFSRYPNGGAVRGGATGLMVKSVLKTGSDMLIGTFDSGLLVVDAATNTIRARHREVVPGAAAALKSVNILVRDSGGRIWSNVGPVVGRLSQDDYRFVPVATVPNWPGQAAGNFSVYSFLECRGSNCSRGPYLLGTNYGVAVLEEHGDSGARIYHLPLPRDHYYALQHLPDGTYLAGRLRGGWLRFLLDGNRRVRLLGRGFLHTGIRDFHLVAGPRPVLFAASEAGLIISHMLTGRTRVLGEEDGLSNGHLYGIVPEADTALWVSTNRGLNRVSFRWSADGMPADIVVAAYGEEDGLQSAEFNSGAFSRAPDGTLVFGGINGINWFRPAGVRANPYAPSAVLMAVSVNEKPIAGDIVAPRLRALRLPHDQNTLAIRFAALEFTQPSAARYSYMLEGFEEGWTPWSSIPEARYAGLPPGRYTFLLRVANAGGVRNPRPLRLPVEIRPPWWATWWARIAAMVLIIGGIIFGIRQYVHARVRRRLRELEKEKAVNDERLRISRDMHDELGSGLTKIALLSEVTKQKLARTKDERDGGLLEQITATSRTLTEKMGEIIWTLNPAADTLDNLAAYLNEYLSELADGLSVGIGIRMPEDIPALRLSNRQRQQILLVTKEAVNNAIKHARASCITVSLVLNGGAIAFKVEDDGAGFVLAEGDAIAGKRNGLGNMCARMESVGGWCRIHTTPGSGTAVEYGVRV